MTASFEETAPGGGRERWLGLIAASFIRGLRATVRMRFEGADTVQMGLPLAEDGQNARADSSALDQAVDDVRARFGEDVIKRASMIDADQGVPVPTLPD